MRWNLFCRVIDNHGDIGVCWRLARGLAGRGHRVRLWVDQPGALAWMAPDGATGVTVQPWTDDHVSLTCTDPGDVVIEAFGCDPPAGFVARMAAQSPPPLWLNLEYLSAEPYVARSHGLPSPQWAGPGAGLVKWFFYPGFSPDTGGLLHGDLAVPPDRNPAPPDDAAGAGAGPTPAPDPDTGTGTGVEPGPAPREVLLFCYDNPALPGLLAWLAAAGPARLRVPPGPAQAALAAQPLPAGLQWRPQRLLAQPEFDHLLARCQLNLVRGEDSFVRAQLASNSPWLWQAYPQQDGAHAAKLEAFLSLYLAGAPAALAGPLAQAFRAFNGLAPWPTVGPPVAEWAAHQRRWRLAQTAQTDLLDRLLAFVAGKTSRQPP